MKILDDKGYKDYYDYIPNVLGVDEKVIFKRKEYLEYQAGYEITQEFNGTFSFDFYNSEKEIKNGYETIGLLVVCGYIYPISIKRICYYETSAEYNILTVEEFENLSNFSFWQIKEIKKMKSYFYNYNEKMEEISKKLDTSIFIILDIKVLQGQNKYKIKFLNKIPLLKDVGFGKIKQSMEIYKELYNYFLKQNPSDPPISVDNKQKIVKAGFDIKESFRHRK